MKKYRIIQTEDCLSAPPGRVAYVIEAEQTEPGLWPWNNPTTSWAPFGFRFSRCDTKMLTNPRRVFSTATEAEAYIRAQAAPDVIVKELSI